MQNLIIQHLSEKATFYTWLRQLFPLETIQSLPDAFRVKGINATTDIREIVESLCNEQHADFAFVSENFSWQQCRVLAMDMDSTLVKNELLEEMAARAGKQEQARRVHADIQAGRYPTYTAALQARIAIFKGSPFSIVEETIRHLQLNEGAQTLINTARSYGLKTYIVSSGLDDLAQPLAEELGMNGVQANHIIVRDGIITGEMRGPCGTPLIDAQGKAEFVRRATQALGATPSASICCGDGSNDIEMVQNAGLGVAFHSKNPALKKAARFALNHGTFESVLTLFDEAWVNALALE